MRTIRYRLDVERYTISNGPVHLGGSIDYDFRNYCEPPLKLVSFRCIDDDGENNTAAVSAFEEEIEDTCWDILAGKTDFVLGEAAIEKDFIRLIFFDPEVKCLGCAHVISICRGYYATIEIETKRTSGKKPERYLIGTHEQWILDPVSGKKRCFFMPQVTEWHGSEKRTVFFKTDIRGEGFWATVVDEHL